MLNSLMNSDSHIRNIKPTANEFHWAVSTKTLFMPLMLAIDWVVVKEMEIFDLFFCVNVTVVIAPHYTIVCSNHKITQIYGTSCLP